MYHLKLQKEAFVDRTIGQLFIARVLLSSRQLFQIQNKGVEIG